MIPNYPKITENGTVSVWFNTPGIDGENAVIIRNGSSISITSENQFQITISNNTDGEPVLGCQISAGPNVINIQDTEPLALDEWVHAALSVDGGQLRVYKNGKLVGVTDYLDRINASTQDWIAIGASVTVIEEEGEEPYYAMNEADAAMFTGLIDDLAIWHVARDAGEIASIYDKGVAGQDATKASVTIPDFVEPGAAADPEISVARNEDGSLTVTFVGKLQTAATVNGPWQDVDAESPVTLTADQAQLFGRAVSE